MKTIKKTLLNLGSLKLFFWTLLWLMFLLVIGTLDQKSIGLYQAQVKYFNSWYFKIGHFPFPAAKPTLALMFLGLISQLLLKTRPKNKNKLGIAIAHFGSFLLLLGGIITNFSSLEGSMIIAEKNTSNFFEDYHQIEFAITGNDELYVIKEADLAPNKTLTIASTNIKISISNFYKNINFIERVLPPSNSEVGFLKKFSITPTNSLADENENHFAVAFNVSGSSQDGNYAVFRDMPIMQTLTAVDGKKYKVEIRHLRHYLPFTITLRDFEKSFYPSSNIPKSFKSEIVLHDGKINQNIKISMNEPLRYKGYTFYQSSFSENSEGEITDLTVVKNYGKLFPYISSIIICFGLFLHLLINKSNLLKNGRTNE